MSDRKTEVAEATDKKSTTGDDVRKSGVIGNDGNQNEFKKAHKKSHSNDKGPSQLEAPAVQNFGIDGIDTPKSGKEQANLARLRWIYDQQGDPNELLGQDLIDCMRDAHNRWKTQHIGAEEQKRDWDKYGKILKVLSGKMFDKDAYVNRIKEEVGH